MKNGILALLCAIGGLALGVLIGSLIFGSKKKTDAVIDEADDSLGFDDDFFTDDIIEDVE